MEIYLISFLSLALAHFVALLSPGVDFFLILTNSSKHGRASGIITSTGIAFANLVYILLALFGITLIKDNQTLFLTIKILGSFYLLYIGFLLLKSKKRELFSKKIEKKDEKKDVIKYFLMGFLSAILNPKNSIFYFTMFSISIQNHTPFYVQSFFALWMFLAVLLWDIFVVYLVTNVKSKNFLEKYSNKIEKISGFILLFLALSIIFNTF
ncbi:LysE family translocator [Arcobacter arenosus]|jgi:threonine/homoserine/homoserine lactone efflux protein|uniref:LysE family translocator n=1 Tax=Arcobacter arenosus TaxID=2576037 RepID=A0A5R8Y2C4_9BACT|nr:LysE family translocator [Arcobacter arenosus]TLP39229.1 LysE family translocator [Arcobacter arenosus]